MKLNKISLALMLSSGLAGCNLDFANDDNNHNKEPVIEIVEPTGEQIALSGKSVKGPLALADVKAYSIDYTKADLKGSLRVSGKTNAQADFVNVNLDPAQGPFLIIVSANDETYDLTTGEAPVITELRTIVQANDLTENKSIYATPLTTLAVQIASADTLTEATLNDALMSAQTTVKTTLGFGMNTSINLFQDASVLNDDTTDTQVQSKIAEHRLAIEAVSAMAVSLSSEDYNANQILTSLSNDLTDGQLDGKQADQTIEGLIETDFNQVSLADLTVPGTDTKVTDIENILNEESSKMGSDVQLDSSINVEGGALNLVVDTDLDGVSDDVDNCVNLANPDQTDQNQNGVGAACENQPVVSDIIANVEEDGSVEIGLNGTDSEGDTLTYTVNGTALDKGETSFTYTPEANFNGQVSLEYSAFDGESHSETGQINIEVYPVNDPTSGEVSITGEATVGQTLTVIHNLMDIDGDISIPENGYQWQADGVDIEGATSDSFTLTPAQAGAEITVVVTYSDGVNDNQSSTTAKTPPVESIELEDTAPTGTASISGTAKEDEVLTAVHDFADADGDIVIDGYTWFADDVEITGQTQSSLTLTQAMVGQAIKVKIDYHDDQFNENYSSTSQATNLVENTNDLPSGEVSIQGTIQAGQTVTASHTLEDEDGLGTVSYQWLVDDTEVAAADSYMLTENDANKTLTLVASYTDLQGTLESATSESVTIAEQESDPNSPNAVDIYNAAAQPVSNINVATCSAFSLNAMAKNGADEDITSQQSFTWSSNDEVLVSLNASTDNTAIYQTGAATTSNPVELRVDLDETNVTNVVNTNVVQNVVCNEAVDDQENSTGLAYSFNYNDFNYQLFDKIDSSNSIYNLNTKENLVGAGITENHDSLHLVTNPGADGGNRFYGMHFREFGNSSPLREFGNMLNLTQEEIDAGQTLESKYPARGKTYNVKIWVKVNDATTASSLTLKTAIQPWYPLSGKMGPHSNVTNMQLAIDKVELPVSIDTSVKNTWQLIDFGEFTVPEEVTVTPPFSETELTYPGWPDTVLFGFILQPSDSEVADIELSNVSIVEVDE